MVDCVECGKRLRFFEGHYHPTLGQKSLVCGLCLLRVEESVMEWRNFVLSNSFNPDAPKSILNINRGSLYERITSIKNHLNYHKNETFVKLGKKTV